MSNAQKRVCTQNQNRSVRHGTVTKDKMVEMNTHLAAKD